MAFPTTQVSTANLDNSADNPGLARVDILAAVQNLNTIVSGANTATGVAVLNGSGELDSNRLPSTYSPSGQLVLSPGNGVVKIQDVLRMQALTTDDVLALTDSEAGDVVFVSNGDAGDPCLAMYANNQWNVIPLNNGTISKDVQAQVTAEFSVICIPD